MTTGAEGVADRRARGRHATAAAGPRPHPRPRPAPVALVVAAGLLLSLLAPAIGLAPASSALAATTDLTLVTNATYEVRPAERLVHVTVKITAKNNKAETRTKRYFFDRATLAVLPGISGLTISGAKGATAAASKRTAAYTMLAIGLGSRLYSGQSRVLTLSFDVKDASATPDPQVRIGGSLASFPVWAFASDGATGSTVAVVFPAGYTVTVESGSFEQTGATADGGTRLSTAALAKPLSFFAYVTGQRAAQYVDTPLTVQDGGTTIALTMRAWQDDPAWEKRVGDLFTKALPVLSTDIGLPWPHADALVVQEAESRTTGGYAALYDPAASRIEVAYWAGPAVVIHEAAHAWFNGTLLADRWAVEGFASLYAERAAATLGEPAASPELTDALKAAAIPLNAWAAQAPDGAATNDNYGYAASLALARLVAERAGDDALRQVWADAAAGIGAYQPPPGLDAAGSSAAPETVSGAPDWRGLLDLLEARTGKDFTDLWRTWVVRPDEAAQLDARAAARTSYSRTLALANGWALPRSIGDALRAWQFDTAEQLMADARTVLAQRSAVDQRAALDGLAVPGTMQAAFQAGSMVDASREAEAELNAMLAVENATASQPDDGDMLVRIGLMGARPDVDLADARTSFEAGNLDATLASANAALSTWAGAWQEGRRRALFAAAVLATVLVLLSAIIGGIRRARQARPARPA